MADSRRPSRQGFRGAGAASSARQVHRWSARRVSPAPFRCRPLAAPSAADHLEEGDACGNPYLRL